MAYAPNKRPIFIKQWYEILPEKRKKQVRERFKAEFAAKEAKFFTVINAPFMRSDMMIFFAEQLGLSLNDLVLPPEHFDITREWPYFKDRLDLSVISNQ